MTKDLNQYPVIVAHRGASRRYPENSLAAIKEAINIAMSHPNMRFYIEADIRSTADNQLVLMHDSYVNRTTTGKGCIEDMTLSDTQNLTMRSLASIEKYSEEFPDREVKPYLPIKKEDLRVATLDEVFSLVAKTNQFRPHTNPIGLALEMKQAKTRDGVIKQTLRNAMNMLSIGLEIIGLSSMAARLTPADNIGRKLGDYLNSTTSKHPPMVLFSSAGITGKISLKAAWQQLKNSVKNTLCREGENLSMPSVVIDNTVHEPLQRIGLKAIQYSNRFWAMGEQSLMPMVTTAKPRNTTESIHQAIVQGVTLLATDFPGHAADILSELSPEEQDLLVAHSNFVEKEQQRLNESYPLSR